MRCRRAEQSHDVSFRVSRIPSLRRVTPLMTCRTTPFDTAMTPLSCVRVGAVDAREGVAGNHGTPTTQCQGFEQLHVGRARAAHGSIEQPQVHRTNQYPFVLLLVAGVYTRVRLCTPHRNA